MIEKENLTGQNRITFNVNQCGGKPCIRNMRIRVSDILSLLAHGNTHDEILVEYPYLEKDDIFAALEYAAKQLDRGILESLEESTLEKKDIKSYKLNGQFDSVDIRYEEES